MANEYWIKREREKLKGHLNDVDKTEKILASNLKKASRDIEDEIYKIYSRYSIDNKISYAEANKLLTGDRYKAWRMDLIDYVKEIEETNNDELLLELNTLSAKSRITRLEENLYQIQKILDKDYNFKHKEVKALLESGVKNSFTQTAYTIDTLNGFHTAFNFISKEEIENIINLPWSGKNYSKRLWNNRTRLKEKVQEQIVQACIQGKDLRKCIRELSATMDTSIEVTKRLINTEHAYACAQGDLKMYQEFDIDSYEYIATLDTRTSNICRHLDGRIFKLSEATPGVNFPPMHPHCRSTTVPADVENLGDETRIAKDSKGNYIYLKADTSYKDYRKALETGSWNNVMHGTKINTEVKKSVVNTHKKMYNIVNNKSLNDSGLSKEIEAQNIKYIKPKRYIFKPTESKIISNLGGGDLTKGSCSSVAFAYIGNKGGLNVRDFRGGDSQRYFSVIYNIRKIANLTGVKSYVVKESNDFKAVSKLLQNMDIDKEYYLATGRHAAIIRKTTDDVQYLELQSVENNGFKPLNNDVLRKRFGCRRSHTMKYIGKYEVENILIDVDSLKGNSEFKQILGYINTNKAKQLKGVGGSVK